MFLSLLTVKCREYRDINTEHPRCPYGSLTLCLYSRNLSLLPESEGVKERSGVRLIGADEQRMFAGGFGKFWTAAPAGERKKKGSDGALS